MGNSYTQYLITQPTFQLHVLQNRKWESQDQARNHVSYMQNFMYLTTDFAVVPVSCLISYATCLFWVGGEGGVTSVDSCYDVTDRAYTVRKKWFCSKIRHFHSLCALIYCRVQTINKFLSFVNS
jgi:hypothetical protein